MKHISNSIVFMLIVNIPLVHGMHTTMHQHEDLKSGDFTLFLDDMVQYMMGYLYTPLPINCKAEYFNNPVFREMLSGISHSNQQDLRSLGMSCKRFQFLSKSCIDRNKNIVNNLIFELLRPSKHTHLTAGNIGLCLTAGADINYRNEWHETPLVYAIGMPACHKFIDGLIKEGAHVNQVGALEKAEYCNERYGGYDAIINLLLEDGAEPTQHEEDDFSSSSESDDVKSNAIDAPVLDVRVPSNPEFMPNPAPVLPVAEGPFALSRLRQGFVAQGSSLKSGLLLSSCLQRIEESKGRPVYASTVSARTGNQVNFAPSNTIPNPATPDVNMFFTHINAHPLLIVVGIFAIGTICYWAYKKYKAYKASKEHEEHDEHGENGEMAVEQVG